MERVGDGKSDSQPFPRLGWKAGQSGCCGDGQKRTLSSELENVCCAFSSLNASFPTPRTSAHA